MATMNKYTSSVNGHIAHNAPAVILLLAHGVGCVKETWEPSIETLFRLDQVVHNNQLVREVWALDYQNHGEACTLNEEVLARSPERFTIWDCADAFLALYKSGLLGYLNPKLHQVVLCGHSAGAVGAVLSTYFFNPSSSVPFSSIILVDPAIWSRKMNDKHNQFFKMAEKLAPCRRDIWKSRQEAAKWLQDKSGKAWNKRVLAKYVEHGIRSLPTAFYPDQVGVTLTTHRLQENFCYSKAANLAVYEALDRLNQICSQLPVHLIYGGRNDMFDRELQDSVISPEEGRSFASVRRIEGAGHQIVHEKPDELASEIFDILSNLDFKHRSKL